MNTTNWTIAAALGALLTGGVANAGEAGDNAGEAGDKAKCYGVAKAGKNDCATSSHSCAGSAKTDNDPAEWKHMPKEACEKAGGKTEAPAKG
jgi:uncharacterized membrane protein